MSGLKVLRNRIASIKSTQKITSAMKMVAASKLRRSEERLYAIRPYAENMRYMTDIAVSVTDFNDLPAFMQANADRPPLYIFITADRGLCGSFSTNILKLFQKSITQTPNFKAIALGKKGNDYLKQNHAGKHIPLDLQNEKLGFQFADAKNLAAKVTNLLEAGEVGSVHIISTNFKTVLSQLPIKETVLPYSAHGNHDAIADVIFEPKPGKLLEFLFKEYFATRFYQMFLESQTAENASRMTAMDSATRNAKEMIQKLQLKYNRTRQANITREIIEIISGAEAI